MPPPLTSKGSLTEHQTFRRMNKLWLREQTTAKTRCFENVGQKNYSVERRSEVVYNGKVQVVNAYYYLYCISDRHTHTNAPLFFSPLPPAFGAAPTWEHVSATLICDWLLIPCKLPTYASSVHNFVFLSWTNCTLHTQTHTRPFRSLPSVSNSFSHHLTEWLVRMLIPACIKYCHLLSVFATSSPDSQSDRLTSVWSTPNKDLSEFRRCPSTALEPD